MNSFRQTLSVLLKVLKDVGISIMVTFISVTPNVITILIESSNMSLKLFILQLGLFSLCRLFTFLLFLLYF